MSNTIKTLKKLRKTERLIDRAFHKHGPKSFKHGQGALLKVLHKHGGAMQASDLIECLSFDRKHLKDVVRKAEKNGYVSISDSEGNRAYEVKLTEQGEKIAEKRCAAQEKTATEILAALNDDEIAEMDATCEKLIVRCKELGVHGARKHGKKHCHKMHHGAKGCCHKGHKRSKKH